MATIDFKKIPTDVPLTAENIDRLTARATELATAFQTRIAKLQQQVADARDRFSREAEEVVRETAPANRTVARQFAKLAADAEFLLSLNQSPAQALGRIALGDTKRLNYQLTLEGAVPVKLETAAVTAIATNDLPLAAAIATVVDRRPFSVGDFAQRVFGAHHAEIVAKLKGVVFAYETAIAADREFVRGQADPIKNLSLALAEKAIAQAAGDEA